MKPTDRVVEIYTQPNCPSCTAAKALLRQRGYTIHVEVHVQVAPSLKEEMVKRSGRTTTPQIFIGKEHIGGCDDLYAADARGEL